MPLFKYYSNSLAQKFSGVANYMEVAKKAIKLMRELKPDIYQNGKILQGVIIRHMILPLCTADSLKVLETIKQEIPNTKVSLLAQYTPFAGAKNILGINRKITQKEYNRVLSKFCELELDGFMQELSSSSQEFIPNFKFV